MAASRLQARANLLLLEDDEDLLELTADALERSGFLVTRARTVSAAELHLRHSAFDAVVADLLVETSDVETAWRDLQRLRSHAPSTPLIVVSGTPVASARLAEHGVSFALQKPFSSRELLSAVSGCLGVQSQPRRD